MAVTFNKPKNIRYVDMCIYIDKHINEIAENNKNPEVESKIFEYLYHIVYALAYRSGYFKDFRDFDSYSCYAASELYLAMRKKLQHQGEEYHGKPIVPVKSCLNFIKATMFPLKVNYQRSNFNTVLDPGYDPEVLMFSEEVRERIQTEYRPDLIDSFDDAVASIPSFLDDLLDNCPFRNDKVIRRRLRLSVLLTLSRQLTLPTKRYQKILQYKETNKTKAADQQFISRSMEAYSEQITAVINWQLPKAFDNYIRVLTNRLKRRFSDELSYYLHSNDLSDNLIDSIITRKLEFDDMGD